MAIKNKIRDPKKTEMSRSDIVVNIKEGSLFYKSNLGLHKVATIEDISTTTTPTTVSVGLSTSEVEEIAGVQLFGPTANIEDLDSIGDVVTQCTLNTTNKFTDVSGEGFVFTSHSNYGTFIGDDYSSLSGFYLPGNPNSNYNPVENCDFNFFGEKIALGRISLSLCNNGSGLLGGGTTPPAHFCTYSNIDLHLNAGGDELAFDKATIQLDSNSAVTTVKGDLLIQSNTENPDEEIGIGNIQASGDIIANNINENEIFLINESSGTKYRITVDADGNLETEEV